MRHPARPRRRQLRPPTGRGCRARGTRRACSSARRPAAGAEYGNRELGMPVAVQVLDRGRSEACHSKREPRSRPRPRTGRRPRLRKTANPQRESVGRRRGARGRSSRRRSTSPADTVGEPHPSSPTGSSRGFEKPPPVRASITAGLQAIEDQVRATLPVEVRDRDRRRVLRESRRTRARGNVPSPAPSRTVTAGSPSIARRRRRALPLPVTSAIVTRDGSGADAR